MIRVLAASLSAAALIAGSLPAAAQQNHKGPSFRGSGQPSFAAKRVSGPKQPVGPRHFRSFNPPAPQISSGQRFHRSFNPPAPFGQPTSAPRAFSRGLAPPSPGGPTASSPSARSADRWPDLRRSSEQRAGFASAAVTWRDEPDRGPAPRRAGGPRARRTAG